MSEGSDKWMAVTNESFYDLKDLTPDNSDVRSYSSFAQLRTRLEH